MMVTVAAGLLLILLSTSQVIRAIYSIYPKHIPGSSFDLYSSTFSFSSSSRFAVIVSASSFHLEITAFFAFLLSKSFHYEVHLWTIGPSFWDTYGNTLISPYISKIFYFQHPYVSHPIENYGKFNYLPNQIQVLIYITAEREISFFKKNSIYEKHLLLMQRSQKILMINHHANDVGGLIPYCQRKDKCSIIHLAKHVYASSMTFLQENETNLVDNQYFYPIFPLSSLLKEVEWNVEKEKKILQNLLTESKREVKRGTIPDQQLRSISRRDKFVGSQYDSLEERSRQTLTGEEVIQLVLPGKVKNDRRNYDDLFTCINSILRSQRTINIHLSILGFGASSVEIPSYAKAYVSLYDRISNELFYSIIENADFVMSFFNFEQRYDSWKASSLMPAAMMLNVPLVLTKQYLKLYPCIANQTYYRKIAQENDCQSLQAALSLSKHERTELKLQSQLCNQQYQERNYITFKHLISVD